MMKKSKLKFSEYMQNISRSKSCGKFVLIVYTGFPLPKWLSLKFFVQKVSETNLNIKKIKEPLFMSILNVSPFFPDFLLVGT
jgi:hypothetical protein